MKLYCPVLAVLFVLAVGAAVGVSAEKHVPAVSVFGDKYL